jgi:hypothetical protein
MKYLIAIVFILLTVQASAQDCTVQSLLLKPGTWKHANTALREISAADLAREKKTIATIHAMVKAKYSPMGVNVLSNGGYSRPLSSRPVNDYTYSMIPLNLYCDGNTVKEVHETSTYFSISSNSLGAEIYSAAEGDRLLLEGFNVISDMPVEKDGYWYFKERNVTLAFGGPGKIRQWLVTYDGKLPFTYVTKKEFLEFRKKALVGIMHNSGEGFKDVLKRNEMEKGFKEVEYKNDPGKLAKYMKMDYTQIKARYEKLLADNERSYQSAFAKIETQLKLPASELAEPALVMMDPQDHLSYLFTTINDPSRQVLIKPNPVYFNKKLPRSSPQFFSIYITGSHTDPITAKAMTDFEKAVDFTLLKKMLGK